MSMPQQRRNSADGANLLLAVIKGKISLRGGVVLQYLRDTEPLLEAHPDLRPEAITTAQAQSVLAFIRLEGRIHQVSTQLADILEKGAVPLDNLIPKFTRRETLPKYDSPPMD